jgi:hypothetical protein
VSLLLLLLSRKKLSTDSVCVKFIGYNLEVSHVAMLVIIDLLKNSYLIYGNVYNLSSYKVSRTYLEWPINYGCQTEG